MPGGARGREEQTWGLVMAAGRKQEDSVLIGATFFTYLLTRPLVSWLFCKMDLDQTGTPPQFYRRLEQGGVACAVCDCAPKQGNAGT